MACSEGEVWKLNPFANRPFFSADTLQAEINLA